ncbi:hypothetical protein Ais01nite_43180 [Asanoa ishikariensis]|uniref:HEAT repeat-containing protein n=1 Tax=Asanoa ishikariensis TaxID=137265 RepID=A0A1H3MQ90_9ACTN|nr:hypothetical protein [Asanoa ishikariensis]GIF66283.1 hypothetical protein Ais01nite_43180 [Asanoa ishikariensis]SDY78912.1 hypothetical protein SAMN05421684_1558 [Asanoa ishikariensis]
MLIDWESEEQLAAAVHGGPAGEASLLAAVPTVAVVAALGEATGPDGVPFLRGLVADLAMEPDLRCAGLVALAKRSGAEASDLLAEALYDSDDSVRNYALVALSCVGDDRAVDHVHALLALDLADDERQRLPFAMQYMSIPAVTYLVRHAQSGEQEDELATLIRTNLARLGKVERDWLTVFWPDAILDQPTGNRPHATDMVAWQPLLATIYPR